MGASLLAIAVGQLISVFLICRYRQQAGSHIRLIVYLEGFGFDAGEAVDGNVASQLPAFTRQSAGLQAG